MTTSSPQPSRAAHAAGAPGPDAEPTLGKLVADASTHVSALVRDEIALAKKEISVDVKKGGLGAVFFAGAAFIALLGVIFLFISIAQGLMLLGLHGSAAYGFVAIFLFIITGVLGWLGKSKISSVTGKPERTIATTKDTIDAVKASAKG